MSPDTEFYIGWQKEIPPSFKRAVRRFITGAGIAIPLLAFLIVRYQSGFSTATFEFGTTTELSGTFIRDPFPFLRVAGGTDAHGQAVFQNILLVAPGKFGFDHIEGAAALKNGQAVKLAGFLVYHDGKTALEVHRLENSTTDTATPENENQPLGAVTLRGEITDPKCMLGVMKPGEGKPHRDCAVRCIAGGIPPVLKVTNTAGETEYYLLAGQKGEALNDCLSDFVADGVQVRGQLEQHGDWLVLYADPATLRRINKGALGAGPMCN
ncbi:MAG: hypothetical protein L6Q97_03755 [Thermoanaerobaculia bacterium]|nr:hypothetical protein [Thermoanaerobaculia bacterium]